MTGGVPAVPVVLAVLAQDVVTAPADDTGRTIMLVIGALLALAVLLAGLTFWYWRRTDPRRRAAQIPGPPAAGAVPAPSARRATPPAGPTPTRRSSPASRSRPPSGEHQRRRQPAGDGISAEEWLRLTGPGPSSGGSRT